MECLHRTAVGRSWVWCTCNAPSRYPSLSCALPPTIAGGGEPGDCRDQHRQDLRHLGEPHHRHRRGCHRHWRGCHRPERFPRCAQRRVVRQRACPARGQGCAAADACQARRQGLLAAWNARVLQARCLLSGLSFTSLSCPSTAVSCACRHVVRRHLQGGPGCGRDTGQGGWAGRKGFSPRVWHCSVTQQQIVLAAQRCATSAGTQTKHAFNLCSTSRPFSSAQFESQGHETEQQHRARRQHPGATGGAVHQLLHLMTSAAAGTTTTAGACSNLRACTTGMHAPPAPGVLASDMLVGCLACLPAQHLPVMPSRQLGVGRWHVPCQLRILGRPFTR